MDDQGKYARTPNIRRQAGSEISIPFAWIRVGLGRWSRAHAQTPANGTKHAPPRGKNSSGSANGAPTVTTRRRRSSATVIGLIESGLYSKSTGPRSSTRAPPQDWI